MRHPLLPSPPAPLPLLGAALLAALVVGAATSSLAASAMVLTDQEQAGLSTAVVVAEVGSAELGVDERWNRAVGRTEVRVVEVISGTAPSQLVVEQFVGRQGSQRYRLPGDARLDKGERCVLFLREVGGTWYLTAMQLSKYTVVHSPLGDRIRREVSEGIFGAEAQAEAERGSGGLLALRTLDELRHSLRTTDRPTE